MNLMDGISALLISLLDAFSNALRRARDEKARRQNAGRGHSKRYSFHAKWVSTRKRMIGELFKARARARRTAIETSAMERKRTKPTDGTRYRKYRKQFKYTTYLM